MNYIIQVHGLSVPYINVQHLQILEIYANNYYT